MEAQKDIESTSISHVDLPNSEPLSETDTACEQIRHAIKTHPDAAYAGFLMSFSGITSLSGLKLKEDLNLTGISHMISLYHGCPELLDQSLEAYEKNTIEAVFKRINFDKNSLKKALAPLDRIKDGNPPKATEVEIKLLIHALKKRLPKYGQEFQDLLVSLDLDRLSKVLSNPELKESTETESQRLTDLQKKRKPKKGRKTHKSLKTSAEEMPEAKAKGPKPPLTSAPSTSKIKEMSTAAAHKSVEGNTPPEAEEKKTEENIILTQSTLEMAGIPTASVASQDDLAQDWTTVIHKPKLVKQANSQAANLSKAPHPAKILSKTPLARPHRSASTPVKPQTSPRVKTEADLNLQEKSALNKTELTLSTPFVQQTLETSRPIDTQGLAKVGISSPSLPISAGHIMKKNIDVIIYDHLKTKFRDNPALQTLNLQGLGLNAIPENIAKFENLGVLDISSNANITIDPSYFPPALQELRMINTRAKSARFFATDVPESA